MLCLAIDSIDYVTGIGNAIEIARALRVAALELELAHFFASGFSMSSTSEESPPPASFLYQVTPTRCAR